MLMIAEKSQSLSSVYRISPQDPLLLSIHLNLQFHMSDEMATEADGIDLIKSCSLENTDRMALKMMHRK